ncbi:MAG: T9SS type A sorting domain-containing protein, partial [Candidatus Latescibacterota bacterium]
HQNLISGNLWFGVDLFESSDFVGQSSGNVLTGNYIGTDISGSARLGNASGGILFNGSGNRIGGANEDDRNLVSGNLGSGIVIFDPDGTIASIGNTVIGNWVGLTSTGDDTLGNLGTGIRIAGSSNRVGGPGPGEGNVVAASSFAAISIRGDETPDSVAHNIVQGNLLGTNGDGSKAFGNVEDGVAIIQSKDNTIGGKEPAEGNLMAGNLGGVFIFGQESTGNLVQGNQIGIDTEGTTGLSNREWGVDIFEAVDNAVVGNLIANNGIAGVNVTNVRPAGKRTRRYASTVTATRDGHGELRYAPVSPGLKAEWPAKARSKSTQVGEGNRIVDNRIFNNVFYGIDLGQDGPTPNDPGDPDDGPNRRQNFPDLEEATVDQTKVRVMLNLPSTTSNTTYPVEIGIYLADDLGQGSDPLQTVVLPATNAEESVEFIFDTDEPLEPGSRVVATATDAEGNTSEFSEPIEVEAGPVSVEEDGAVPGALRLLPNFPNPVANSTTIQYDLDVATEVTISIYDGLGREVDRLLDRVARPVGTSEVTVSTAELSSGVYTLVLEAGGRRRSLSMMVVK